MNFIFFGTPNFAAIILEKLINSGLIPAVVVCNPDRPVGRKKIMTPPPVKQSIMNYESSIKDKIKILQPENLEIAQWKSEINKLGGIDFAIVAAYAKIIPKEILDSLPAKFVGVHPSLLPKYRGPTPIQSAILNGEREVGVTLYLLDKKIDHGPIIARRILPKLEGEDPPATYLSYEALEHSLANLATGLLIDTLPKFLDGEIKPVPQDESRATYTKKFTTEEAYIEPADLGRAQKHGGEAALKIERKIRALNPEPGVWTIFHNKRVKLLEAELENGKLKLTVIQREGRKPEKAKMNQE